MTTWKSVLTEALQGDSAAIEAVAQRLETGPSEEDRRTREDFTDAVDGWRAENGDLLTKEFYGKVTKEDTRLASDPEYAHLDYRTRLNLAGNAVRRGAGMAERNEEADSALSIQRMAEARRLGVAGNKVFLEDTDQQAIARTGRRAATVEEED